MSCEFTEQVSLLIDGELPANDASRVERHVIGCSECQQARADFLNMRREISDYQITLDPRAQERALAAILASREKFVPRQIAGPGWRERFAAFGVPRFATAMATACALLLAVVFGIMMYRNSLAPREEMLADAGPKNPPAVPPSSRPRPQPSPNVPAEKGPEPNKTKTPTHKRDFPAPVRPPRSTNMTAPNYVLANNSTTTTGTTVVSSADTETLTAQHVEQSSLLLRAFRNTRLEKNDELAHEKNRARQLLYQNILLRREATTKGNVQVATLLDSLEPILIDIANLPARPGAEEVRTIKQRMERKNLVPLLQVNSTQLARAFD